MNSRWLTRPPPSMLHGAWIIRALKCQPPNRLVRFSNLALEGAIVVAVLILGCC